MLENWGRSWRSSEHERSWASNRQFSQPRQPNYGRANTSLGREIDACYSCHHHGHYARECPECRAQLFRRGRGGTAFSKPWSEPRFLRTNTTVVRRTEVRSAVQPSIQPAGRSTETGRSTNPLSSIRRYEISFVP